VKWPLVHQFGFIPANAYTNLELEDGEYSACDLLSMGVIPIALQAVIKQFATEIGSRVDKATETDFMQQWQQVRAAALLRAISIAMAAGAQVAEQKQKMINDLPAFVQ
jgi:hypothetical protein